MNRIHIKAERSAIRTWIIRMSGKKTNLNYDRPQFETDGFGLANDAADADVAATFLLTTTSLLQNVV